ncbi:MAG: amino-acid N-acetyltransferase, partial [Salinispira sp.]
SLIRDMALLRHNGFQLLLVPGAQLQIDNVLQQFDRETNFKEGLRISGEENMPLIVMAAFDVAHRLMTEFSSQQLDSVIGNWVRAQSLGVVEGNDFQMTGSVQKINTEQILRILDDGIIPILPCVGWNATGQTYNISSLKLARALAVELQAEKLFYISDSFSLNVETVDLDGVETTIFTDQVSSLSIHDAEIFLAQNKERLKEDDFTFISESIQAVSSGVTRAHILNGSLDGAILREIFSTQGCGVMIHMNPFNEIRSMEVHDISDVLRIMAPEVERGNLRERSRRELLKMQDDFIVYESDGSIQACAALHRYGEDMAEIAALAVDPPFNNLGIGNKLLLYMIEHARKQGIAKVFVLTTQAADWFLNAGFHRAEPSILPEERPYNNDRNSRIYCLEL